MKPQPLICVSDVPASSRWFQRVLGMESAHGGAEYEQLTFDGQLVLQLHAWDVHEHVHLGTPSLQPRGNGVALWYESTDIETAYERAKAAGAEIIEAVHVNPLAQHLEFWLREPNGYVVVVSSAYGDLGSHAQKPKRDA